MTISWFIKTIRSGKRYEDGTLPPEVWQEGVVCPTLNAFDNTGDSRATVIIFYGNRVADIRVQGDVINTLQARMGTGGNNMPMVARINDGENMAIPIHDAATRSTGKRKIGDDKWVMDGKGNGLGIGNEGDPMNTLTSGDRHAVSEDSVVRRLTPTECERLQGFPDDWTAGQSDTHRYKQMGNAVTVNVANWVFNRLADRL